IRPAGPSTTAGTASCGHGTHREAGTSPPSPISATSGSSALTVPTQRGWRRRCRWYSHLTARRRQAHGRRDHPGKAERMPAWVLPVACAVPFAAAGPLMARTADWTITTRAERGARPVVRGHVVALTTLAGAAAAAGFAWRDGVHIILVAHLVL